jgi:phage-related protein
LDPDDFRIVMAGLAKLRSRQYHKPPLSKPIGDELFEMRHVGKLNTRVFYFFAKGQRIIAVHGIRNKGQRISERDRKVALERKRDWWLREA